MQIEGPMKWEIGAVRRECIFIANAFTGRARVYERNVASDLRGFDTAGRSARALE